MARSKQQDTLIELLNQEEVWSLCHATLSDHVRIVRCGDETTQGDVIDVLLDAASTAGTIEQSCDRLSDVGGGNGIRYHLNGLGVEAVQDDINAALAAHRPKTLLKRPRKVAIDIVLIPYYGTVDQADADYLIRSQAKCGTTRFFGYATLCLLHRHRRYTLSLVCLKQSASLLDTLKTLLTRFEALGGRIKHLLLDAGFYAVSICRYLMEEAHIPFVMPAPCKGRTGGIRKLMTGPSSYKTTYTMKSPKDGTLKVPVILVRAYSKGRYKKKGVIFFAYVAYKWHRPIDTIYQAYRQRFGIEKSYALMHAVRARTRSRRPAVRALAVGVALLLVNLWVYLKWAAVSIKRRGGRLVLEHLFSFKTMVSFLHNALLKRHGSVDAVYLPEGGLNECL